MTNFILFNNCHIGHLKNAEELGIWLVGPDLYQGVDNYGNTFYFTVDNNHEIVKSIIGKDDKSLHFLISLLINRFSVRILGSDDFLLHCKFYDWYMDHHLGYFAIEERVNSCTNKYRNKLRDNNWREYYGLTIHKSVNEINPELDHDTFLDDKCEPYGADYHESEWIED